MIVSYLIRGGGGVKFFSIDWTSRTKLVLNEAMV